MGRFLALPANSSDYSLQQARQDPKTAERMQRFGGDRSPVYYDEALQRAHHIHFIGGEHYRLLQHHYGRENTPVFMTFCVSVRLSALSVFVYA